jgi:probable F420-dependent oxidoreductase
MPKIELGRIGAVVQPGSGDEYHAAVREIEALGIPTIWITGGPLEGLWQVADVIRNTERARIATAILSVDRFPADDVSVLYEELEHEHPGRFVVGLGGAHGAKPIETLTSYLEALNVPRERLVFAALGPRMAAFGRDYGAGLLPLLITPEYTAGLRDLVGGNTSLAVELLVALEPDPDRARAQARERLSFLGSLPAYQASFRRLGFTQDEIDTRADRLIDTLVAWGDAKTIAARVAEQFAAGADHVAVNVIGAGDVPVDAWRQLVGVLAEL